MEEQIYVPKAPAWFIIRESLGIKLKETATIIQEDPETIRSWFAHPEPFKGNYFEVGNYFDLDNSPVHNKREKYEQLVAVANHIEALIHIVGCEVKVKQLLTRKRRKLCGRSFACVAKGMPNTCPTENGFHELLERLQDWCQRKDIALPETLARV